jgi:hypothetical protein
MEQIMERLIAAIEKMGAKIDNNQKQMKTRQQSKANENRPRTPERRSAGQDGCQDRRQ